MRPRVFPAEDLPKLLERVALQDLPASMRPRVFPAEDIYYNPEWVLDTPAELQ